MYVTVIFCFKQKTAYEMRISDWSSDVCSSDLVDRYGTGAVSAHGVRRRLDQADRLSRAVGLDMVDVGWLPTVANSLGRVTKPRILDAVGEFRRAHVLTPVTNAHLLCLLLLPQNNRHTRFRIYLHTYQ